LEERHGEGVYERRAGAHEAALEQARKPSLPARIWRAVVWGPYVLTIDQREALNLLARSTHGHRESILLAHGFPIETLRSLLRIELIIAEREPAFLSRGESIVVTRVRITDAGRRAVD